MKNPQPLAHTFQSTPALVVSWATAAFILTVAFGCTCAGSDGMKLTVRRESGVIVMALDVILTLVFATEVAVSVTEVPAVVAGGAV